MVASRRPDVVVGGLQGPVVASVGLVHGNSTSNGPNFREQAAIQQQILQVSYVDQEHTWARFLVYIFSISSSRCLM